MLSDFYEKVLVTHEVFKKVQDNNKKHEIKKDLEEDKSVLNDELTIKDVHTKIIVSSLKTQLFISIIKELIEIMKKHNFNEVSSVRSVYQKIGFSNNQYQKLAQIDLFKHTINVALETKKILFQVNNTPIEAIEISVLIALLHDFGKSPVIISKYKEDENHKHQHISATFSKTFLEQFKKNGMTEEVIQLIYKTIFSSHDTDSKNKNFFKDILIEADSRARNKEIKYLNKISAMNNKGNDEV